MITAEKVGNVVRFGLKCSHCGHAITDLKHGILIETPQAGWRLLHRHYINSVCDYPGRGGRWLPLEEAWSALCRQYRQK